LVEKMVCLWVEMMGILLEENLEFLWEERKGCQLAPR
jgi:hypothetical protein